MDAAESNQEQAGQQPRPVRKIKPAEQGRSAGSQVDAGNCGIERAR